MDITPFSGFARDGNSWFGYGNFGWPWPGLLLFVVPVLFWAGLMVLLIWAVHTSAGPYRPSADMAREVLRRRLASGEISEEEYVRINRLLCE